MVISKQLRKTKSNWLILLIAVTIMCILLSGCNNLAKEQIMCYNECLEEKGNTDAICKQFCAANQEDREKQPEKEITGCKSDRECKEIICPGGGFVHERCIEGKCVLKSACLQSNSTIIKPNITQSSGTYTCKSCSGSHSWYIDEGHMLWWDNQPYIPYAGFAVKNITNIFNLTEFNIWIDTDPGNIHQYPNKLDEVTSSIINGGGTYIVLFLTGPAIQDASQLLDPTIKQQVIDSWKPYVSAVSKDGLRGMIIWNEINNGFKWPNSYTADQYGRALGEYAKELKELVGDVPVIFKIVDMSYGQNNYDYVIAGASSEYADGIGFDLFVKNACTSYKELNNPLNTVISKLHVRQNKTKLLWITEFGNQGDETVCSINKDYWCNFPPYSSQADMKCMLDKFVEVGAKGVIYNGPGYNGNYAHYYNSYVWYSGFKSEIIKKAKAARSPNISLITNTGTIESGTQTSCYASCMKEAGNTDKVCTSWCSGSRSSSTEVPAGEPTGTTSGCYNSCMAEAGNTASVCANWCASQEE